MTYTNVRMDMSRPVHSAMAFMLCIGAISLAIGACTTEGNADTTSDELRRSKREQDSGVVAPPVTTTVTPPPVADGSRRGVYIDAAGTVVADGKKFFPFGFYSNHWSDSFESRIDALRKVAAGGFNTFLAEDIATPQFGDLLDEAQRLNVRVLVGSASLPEMSYLGDSVTKYKSKPAVLGWSMFDDSDDGRLTFADLKARHDYVKQIDPDHITFSTLTGYYTQRRTDKGKWLDASDSSGLQMYPFGAPSDFSRDYGGSSLTESFQVSRDYVVAAEQRGKAMFINSQAYRWELPGGRYPTVLETRNMVLGQIFAGAKGIVAFNFTAELYAQTEVWNELVAIKTDVLSTLAAPLLDGTLTRKPTTDIDVNFAIWMHAGACYVGALNTATQAKPASLSLPAECTGKLTLPVERLTHSLSLTGSLLTGTLEPMAAQIYRIGN
jgi:hypothetical protein